MKADVESGRDSLDSLEPAQLRACAVGVLKRGENTRADVLLLEHDGNLAVLKDYENSNRGFALVIAPLLVWREVRALRKLEGLDGIPSLLRRVSSRSFLMEYCESRGLGEMPAGFGWESYISRAQALVAAMHDRGVVHGDLRNFTNFMATDAGAPVLVDFVSAVHRGARWNPLGALLFNACLQLDEGGIYKLKKRYAANLVSERERARFESGGPLESAARALSRLVRTTVRKVFGIR